jgi:hypothetical protein
MSSERSVKDLSGPYTDGYKEQKQGRERSFEHKVVPRWCGEAITQLLVAQGNKADAKWARDRHSHCGARRYRSAICLEYLRYQGQLCGLHYAPGRHVVAIRN